MIKIGICVFVGVGLLGLFLLFCETILKAPNLNLLDKSEYYTEFYDDDGGLLGIAPGRFAYGYSNGKPLARRVYLVETKED